MVTKIIIQGHDPKYFRYQINCINCGTVFSFEESDIVQDQRDGDFTYCPICAKGISTKIARRILDSGKE